MKKILLVTLISSFIIACGGGDGNNSNNIVLPVEPPVTEPELPTEPEEEKTEEELFQEGLVFLYSLPPEPDPEVNNLTINGVDTNNNLIRDDWERAIVFTFHEDITNMNLHNALAKNTTLLNNYYEDMNIDGYLKESKEEQYIVECASYFYGLQKFNNRELFKKGADTKDRLNYILKRESIMSEYLGDGIHGTPRSKLEAICQKYK